MAQVTGIRRCKSWVKGALRRNENNKVWNLDPYLQASWALTESWTLDAGLRYSRIRFRSEDHYVEPGNAELNTILGSFNYATPS